MELKADVMKIMTGLKQITCGHMTGHKHCPFIILPWTLPLPLSLPHTSNTPHLPSLSLLPPPLYKLSFYSFIFSFLFPLSFPSHSSYSFPLPPLSLLHPPSFLPRTLLPLSLLSFPCPSLFPFTPPPVLYLSVHYLIHSPWTWLAHPRGTVAQARGECQQVEAARVPLGARCKQTA